jgi:hypothetical protein
MVYDVSMSTGSVTPQRANRQSLRPSLRPFHFCYNLQLRGSRTRSLVPCNIRGAVQSAVAAVDGQTGRRHTRPWLHMTRANSRCHRTAPSIAGCHRKQLQEIPRAATRTERGACGAFPLRDPVPRQARQLQTPPRLRPSPCAGILLWQQRAQGLR